MKLPPEKIRELVNVREAILEWLAPPPPDPDRVKWEAEAKRQLAEIETSLMGHFFPEPKDEGTQTKKEDGFQAKLVTSQTRKIDAAALDALLTGGKKATVAKLHLLFDWEPKFKLKEFRKLPQDEKSNLEIHLAEVITATPDKPKFSISKL